MSNDTFKKPSKTEVLAARGKPAQKPPSVGRLDGAGATKEVAIVIPRAVWKEVPVLVRGTAPLMQHAWSAKAIKQMLSAQMNPGKTTKEKRAERTAKNPWEDFLEAISVDDDGLCSHRSAAFKESMITACRMIPSVTMTNLQQAIRVQGEMCPVYGRPMFRMDMVHVDLNKPKHARSADVRFRPIYEEWGALLNIRYREKNIELDSLLNLLAEAGESQGIGEMRAERGHNFGLWDIVSAGNQAVKDSQAMKKELGRTFIGDLKPENTGMDDVLGDLAPDVREMIGAQS